MRPSITHTLGLYTRRGNPISVLPNPFSHSIHSFAYSSLQLWQCGRTTTVNIPPVCLSLFYFPDFVTFGRDCWNLLQCSCLFPTSRHHPSSGIDPHLSPNVVVLVVEQETLWQVKIYPKRKKKRESGKKLSHHLWPPRTTTPIVILNVVKYRGILRRETRGGNQGGAFLFSRPN